MARNGSVHFRSSPMQHYFDCPRQFGSYPDFVAATDTAADAEEYGLEVQPGDVIIMGRFSPASGTAPINNCG